MITGLFVLDHFSDAAFMYPREIGISKKPKELMLNDLWPTAYLMGHFEEVWISFVQILKIKNELSNVELREVLGDCLELNN